jgi:hypothetical protein
MAISAWNVINLQWLTQRLIKCFMHVRSHLDEDIASQGLPIARQSQQYTDKNQVRHTKQTLGKHICYVRHSHRTRTSLVHAAVRCESASQEQMVFSLLIVSSPANISCPGYYFA